MGDSALDVLILGGGPAGLTAGIYAARARMNVLLVEKGLVGGQPLLTDVIENYPGFMDGITGTELMERMQRQAESLGLETRKLCGAHSVVASDKGYIVDTDEDRIEARTVIVATGAHPSRLGVPGEADLTGRGVSYCATCDGALFRDKDIVVVGGGNAAIEEALFLTRFASKVTVVHRRDELRAAKILQERVFADEKIRIVWDSVVTKILGDGVVSGAELLNKKTDQTQVLDADGVFIYVGTIPNSEPVVDLVDLDERGFILTDDRLATSAPGVFAAGDVRASHLRQVVVAAGDGALASVSAQKHCEEL